MPIGGIGANANIISTFASFRFGPVFPKDQKFANLTHFEFGIFGPLAAITYLPACFIPPRTAFMRPHMANPSVVDSDTEALDKLRDAHKRLRKEVGKIIIGQEAVLDQLLMAIFCRVACPA